MEITHMAPPLRDDLRMARLRWLHQGIAPTAYLPRSSHHSSVRYAD